MRLAVASGKGGTGKTTVAVNLARVLAGRGLVQLLDCDVEEPNAHLFLKPALSRKQEVTLPVPRVDPEKCTGCGLCARVCAFHALAVIKGRVLVFPELCHGCGGCSRLCPAGAIAEVPKRIGAVEEGMAGEVRFAHGRLQVGCALAPPLVKAVTGRARDDCPVILDAPPGTACPVVATVQGCDYCLLVTEPTPFGRHDLDLAAGMVKGLGVRCGVVLNRAGQGDALIEDYCAASNLPLVAKIPFAREFASSYAQGNLLAERHEVWRQAMAAIWQAVKRGVEA